MNTKKNELNKFYVKFFVYIKNTYFRLYKI